MAKQQPDFSGIELVEDKIYTLKSPKGEEFPARFTGVYWRNPDCQILLSFTDMRDFSGVEISTMQIESGIYWSVQTLMNTAEEKFIELKKLYDQVYSIDGGEESQAVEKQKRENFTRIDSIFNSFTPEEKREWANRH